MGINIGIIVGSNRPTRVARTVAEWAQRTMKNDKLNLEIIDLAEINLPFLDEPEVPARHHYTQNHTKEWSNLIRKYDGFVIVFPQYNWGYPAVLKNAMDYLYDEWNRKPVSLICYGSHGGFQAALAMKLVIQGLNMYSLSTNPALDIDEHMFNDKGQFNDIDDDFARYSQSLRAVSDEFVDLLS